MNDKLKPNQEKKVIENFVECIMDDLDYYHFDELIIEKYKKELFQFFTKISEERSLFSPGFDFSNKKNIVNDKEKIKDTLDHIAYLLKRYRVDRLNLATEGSNYEAQVSAGMVKDLEKIQDKLIGQ